MEAIKEFIFTAYTTYGVWGITLAAILIVLFITQLVFHLGIYGRVASFRLTSRKQIRDVEPPISVVVTMFSEEADYLDNGLMHLLDQNYTNFEVVVVYVGDNDDFFAELKYLTRISAHLTPIHLRTNPSYVIKKKMAINVGIKSAKYDHIVMTTTDAMPTSDKWLSLIAKGFLYGDVVLGYSGIITKSGFGNFIFREHRISTSVAWLSAAIRRKSYAASHSALGFARQLYLDARGFNHLDMEVGEDDLLVQQIATRDNVSVVLAPSATCRERIWGGWSWWANEVSRQRLTHRYYRRMTLAPMYIEQFSRLLFFGLSVAAFATMQWEYCAVVGALIFLRYFAVMFASIRIWRRLGETRLVALHPIYDLAEPFIRLYIILHSKLIAKRAWRV